MSEFPEKNDLEQISPEFDVEDQVEDETIEEQVEETMDKVDVLINLLIKKGLITEEEFEADFEAWQKDKESD